MVWLIAGWSVPLAAQQSGAGGPATDEAAAAAEVADPPPMTFFEIVFSGGPIGIACSLSIILLSVAAVALTVEYALTIRAAVLIPAGLADQTRELLRKGQAGEADRACRERPSVLAFVLQAGLAELDGGWPVVEKAMEDAAADQAARLQRKIEWLSVIAALAPMLGLLGTVLGMIQAFREVAESQGAAQAADLAEGIYLALVTTVEGLIVAIPSLGVYALFRSRVEQLLAEVASLGHHAFGPLRRATAAARRGPAVAGPGSAERGA